MQENGSKCNAQVVPFTVQTRGEQVTVSARELYKALHSPERFSKWFERFADYGFETGTDFNPYQKVQVQKEGDREVKRGIDDYEITLEMAKQICMLQRTDLGAKYRKYFLELEKDWNSPEKVMSRALAIANKELEEFKAKTRYLESKALFADAVSASKTSILIGDLAKILKQNGHDIGQKRLFDWLRCHGYLIKGGASKNMPTQKAMERGLFQVKESTISNPDGSIRVTRTTKVTGKGQVYFINRFMKPSDAAEATA